MVDWPLEHIACPHAANDVVWHHDKKQAVSLFLEECRSEKCNPEYAGNRRLWKHLEEHLEEYQAKNAFTKPMVAVDLVRLWRAQSPPGRFLV